ncbi:hypothetical protein J6590_066499 [Homalodisca vitripennis]|nr:hypothetical protein J6590_066499 [Homalodisca vitripennis]
MQSFGVFLSSAVHLAYKRKLSKAEQTVRQLLMQHNIATGGSGCLTEYINPSNGSYK